MWLTGFDAPCMHTMYVDKPMKGHGLMQAIARVNRVFRDKPAGLVVDYIGIAQNLKSALGQYSPRRPRADRHRRGRSRPRAAGEIRDRPRHVPARHQGRVRLSPGAGRRRDAAGAPRDHGRRHRLGADAAAGGRRQGDDRRRQEAGAPALRRCCGRRSPRRSRWPAASDEARAIRDEVGFFQAIRAALVKSVPGDGKRSTAERELAIQQIVSRAVVSTEIVDIMKAAGLESPDISILSDEFLAEVRDMPTRRTSPSRR